MCVAYQKKKFWKKIHKKSKCNNWMCGGENTWEKKLLNQVVAEWGKFSVYEKKYVEYELSTSD